MNYGLAMLKPEGKTVNTITGEISNKIPEDDGSRWYELRHDPEEFNGFINCPQCQLDFDRVSEEFESAINKLIEKDQDIFIAAIINKIYSDRSWR